MSTQTEIDFLLETAIIEKSFLDAKENKNVDLEQYISATNTWESHRKYWREIREWFQAINELENK